MKYTFTAFCALSTLICLAITPAAQARGVRADMGCPYAGGVGTAWSPPPAPIANPYNSGLSTNYTATLVADVSQLSSPPSDEVGLTISAATQYDTYLQALEPSQCGPGGVGLNEFFAPSPATQVVVYTIGDNNVLGSGAPVASGDKEIEFNYDFDSGNSTNNNAVKSAIGTASFTVGTITYSSIGPNLPFNTDNDFLFSASGVLLGSLIDDTNGQPELVSCKAGASISTCVPGWTSAAAPTSAPEIDSSSMIAALTLLAGGLAVLRGRRPSRMRLT
jgi:hypothetical protein